MEFRSDRIEVLLKSRSQPDRFKLVEIPSRTHIGTSTTPLQKSMEGVYIDAVQTCQKGGEYEATLGYYESW
jgi:hypothetical protein